MHSPCKEEVVKTVTSAVLAALAAAVIIFSVVSGVKGLITSVQQLQAYAIAPIHGKQIGGEQ